MNDNSWNADMVHWYEIDFNGVRQLIGPFTHKYLEKVKAKNHLYRKFKDQVDMPEISKALNTVESTFDNPSKGEEVRNKNNEIVFILTRHIEFDVEVAKAVNGWTDVSPMNLFCVHTRIVPDNLESDFRTELRPFVEEEVLTLPIGPEIKSYPKVQKKTATEYASALLESSRGVGEQVSPLYDDEDLWVRAVIAGEPSAGRVKCLVMITRVEVTSSKRVGMAPLWLKPN
ncbi:Nn.00g074540.m01.CDS01 [Neocucurbitaria sp. VM-36]